MTLSAGSRMIARYIVVMILPDDGDMDVVKLLTLRSSSLLTELCLSIISLAFVSATHWLDAVAEAVSDSPQC